MPHLLHPQERALVPIVPNAGWASGAGMDVQGEENMSCRHWGLKVELSSL